MGVVRLRRRWDPDKREMVDVPIDIGPRKARVHIMDDIPDYESPVTGKLVSGRRQRREDLKRTGSRPYEGREQEVKEANRTRAENERKQEVLIDKMARTGLSQLSTRSRKILLGR